MKDNHLSHAGRSNLLVLLNERLQVQVAHGTPGKTPELQMHDCGSIRDQDALRADRFQLTCVYSSSGFHPRAQGRRPGL